MKFLIIILSIVTFYVVSLDATLQNCIKRCESVNPSLKENCINACRNEYLKIPRVWTKQDCYNMCDTFPTSYRSNCLKYCNNILGGMSLSNMPHHKLAVEHG